MPLIRTSRNQVIAPVIDPVLPHPGWIPGRYYGTPLAWIQDSVGNHVVNLLNWQHFPVLNPLTIDAIALRVNAFSGASVRARMGIYNVPKNSPLPTTKILDSGIITITSVGVKQALFPPLLLPAGMYAIAFAIGDTNTALTILGTASNRHPAAMAMHGTDSFVGGLIYHNQNCSQLSSFALPSDLSSITSWFQRLESPSVLVRVA